MFRLDSRIADDTHPVAELALCALRLKRTGPANPWLILVPRIDGLVELHDLAPPDRHRLIDEVARTGAALASVTGCDKVNTAAFGNMVPQLHVHVIARFRDDRWWPGALDMAASAGEWREADLLSVRDRLRQVLGAP